MDDDLILANLIILGMATVFGLITGFLARRKHRNKWLWGLCGALTFPVTGVALACVSILCPQCREPLANEQWKDKACPYCGSLQ